MFTEDLNIIVLINTDQEYLNTFTHVAKVVTAPEAMHHVLSDVLIQMLPRTTKPLLPGHPGRRCMASHDRWPTGKYSLSRTPDTPLIGGIP